MFSEPGLAQLHARLLAPGAPPLDPGFAPHVRHLPGERKKGRKKERRKEGRKERRKEGIKEGRRKEKRTNERKKEKEAAMVLFI